MFKIGDFSRLTHVPIKTLHHYDDIGLFKPAQVDRFTGYRYYSFDQLPLLNRILALSGLGFSLEQIKQIVGDGVSGEELRGMLRLRRAQLQQQIDDQMLQLSHVELRLRQIEQEGKMSDVEVLIKQVPQVAIVGAREVVPDPSLMRERCMALNDRACELIEAANLKTDGISLALYHSANEQGIDVEMAYTVDNANAPGVYILPGATVAYAVYHGSYDDFGAVGQLHGAVMTWLEASGYRVTGACREYYLRPPQSPNDATGVMEIQYPVAMVGKPSNCCVP